MKKKKIKNDNSKKAIAAAFAAACAFTGCTQAQAADYNVSTFDGENGLQNAFQNGQYSSDGGTTVESLQTGDRIIMEGDISVPGFDALTEGVNGLILDGQGHTLTVGYMDGIVYGKTASSADLTIKDLNVSDSVWPTSVHGYTRAGLLKFEGTNNLSGALLASYGSVEIADGASLTTGDGTSVGTITNNGTYNVTHGSYFSGAPVKINNYSQSDEATLNVSAKKANLGIDGTIGGNVAVSEGAVLNITKGNIETSKTLDIQGDLNIAENSSVKAGGDDFNWGGKITVNGGTLDTTGATSTNANASIDATQGIVKLGGTNTLNNSNIALGVETTLKGDQTLSSGTTVELGEGDSWDGSPLL